jgi:hypothetical protein
MLEKIENEIKLNELHYDIRDTVLVAVLASFTPEEIDEKVKGAKEMLAQLKNQLTIKTLVKELEMAITKNKYYDGTLDVLVWAKDEIKKESSDTPESEIEESQSESLENTKEETKA